MRKYNEKKYRHQWKSFVYEKIDFHSAIKRVQPKFNFYPCVYFHEIHSYHLSGVDIKFREKNYYYHQNIP